MTEPHQTEHKAGQEGSGHDQEPTENPAQPDAGVQHDAPAAETTKTEADQAAADTADSASAEASDAAAEPAAAEPAKAADSTEPAATEPAATETASTEKVSAAATEKVPAAADGEAEAEAEAEAEPKPSNNTGLLLGIGGGAAVLLIVALVVGAFVWPGFLAGPGKPDDKAAAAVAALGGKNPAELDKVSCHGPDGKVTTQIPPEALQLITEAKPAGPAHLSIDTEALAPVDLTISSNGQSKTAPVDIVLGVTHNEWCMKRISQRQ